VPAVVFTAVDRFDAAAGESWAKYIAWSGLIQLREVVSLDIALCPKFLKSLLPEDWEHNVQADFRTDLFHDADYVIRRVGDAPVNVLAVIEEPSVEDVASFVDARFLFRGFDLIEEQTGISALMNCGGFDKAFLGSDLSDCGLLVDHADAQEVQRRLREEYPEESHADCQLWAIWTKR
jgi:hypothetical protein